MKFLGLVIAGFRRNRVRNALTTVSIVVAFLLFALLRPIAMVFEAGPPASGNSRLIVAPKHSISDMLNLAHYERIRTIEGAVMVAHQTWFGGLFSNEEVNATEWAISPEFLRLYPEYVLTEGEKAAFQSTRTGAIIGRELADELGIKIGDRVPLRATIWYNHDGAAWYFDVVGIYEPGSEYTNARRFMFRYDYFDEYRAFANGTLSNVIVSVRDADQMIPVALAIDALFENSAGETLTQNEREYALGFIRQFGDIGLVVNAILLAVFFTLLMLTTNTMAQGIRERIPEMAIMKTIGFTDTLLLSLVLAESLLMWIGGAVIGVILALIIVRFQTEVPGLAQLGGVRIGPDVIGSSLVVAALTGIGVALHPALTAHRATIVDSLRRHGT